MVVDFGVVVFEGEEGVEDVFEVRGEDGSVMKSRWLFEEPPMRLSDMRMHLSTSSFLWKS